MESLASTIDIIEKLSDGLNIPKELDKPTTQECLLFWRIQVPSLTKEEGAKPHGKSV